MSWFYKHLPKRPAENASAEEWKAWESQETKALAERFRNDVLYRGVVKSYICWTFNKNKIGAFFTGLMILAIVALALRGAYALILR